MKILVVKPTALGDVAQALLVAPLLRRIPGCTELVWLIDEDYQSLVQRSPLVDRLILFPRKRWRRRWLSLECFRWLRQLRKEKFDLVVDLQGLARSALMTWATGAPRRLGLASAREGAGIAYTETVQDDAEHAVDRYAQAVSAASGNKMPLSHTYLSAENTSEDALPDGLVAGHYTVLHPYSLWTSKQWNWQNYENLAKALPGETFVLVGQGTFFPVLAPNCVDLRNRTNLAQLLSILSQARVVISTDSGPLHLAAAFGKPVIGLFGASSGTKTGVRSSQAIMIQAGKKSPQNGHRIKYPSRNLMHIEVEKVLKSWQELAN